MCSRDGEHGSARGLHQNPTAPERAPLASRSLARSKPTHSTSLALLLDACCRSSDAVAGSSLFDSIPPPCARTMTQDSTPLAFPSWAVPSLGRRHPRRPFDAESRLESFETAQQPVVTRGSITMKSVFTITTLFVERSSAMRSNIHYANFVRRIRFFGFGILAHLPHRRARPLSLLAALTVIAYAPDPSITRTRESLSPRHAPFGLLTIAKVNPSRGPLPATVFPPSASFPCRKRTASAWPCCARWTCLPTVITSPCNFTVHVC
jgi:hypothetical protein